MSYPVFVYFSPIVVSSTPTPPVPPVPPIVYVSTPIPFEPDYQVMLMATDGTILDVIDMSRIQVLEYTRIVNNYGVCSLTIDADDRAAQFATRLDMLIEIYRRNEQNGDFEKEDTYFARYFNRFEDESGEEFVIISGVQLTQLLERRIILAVDDPLNAGGFSTKFDIGSTVMWQFVNEQCVNPASNALRAFPQLTISADPLAGFLVFQRRAYENLLVVLQEIATQSQMDFYVERTTGANLRVLIAVTGTDKTLTSNYPFLPYVLFDPRRGNMRSPNLTVNRKSEKTLMFVMGQGLDGDRVAFPVTNGVSIDDSIWNRIEATTDSRNDTDTDGLLASGTEALNDAGIEIAFSFEPDLFASQGRYNVDWFLGDKVTALYGDYQTDLRVMQVSVTVNTDQTVVPTLERIRR